MKNLLKYLIVFLVIAVFQNAAGRFEIAPESLVQAELSIESYLDSDDLSSPESCLTLPSHVSVSSPVQVGQSARRTDCNSRHNHVFVKSGRLINTGIRYFIQKTSLVHTVTLTQHSSRLIYLGKLII